MKKVIWVVVAFVLTFGGFAYFSDDHQDFLAFDREREEWHRQCDAYVGKTEANAPHLAELAAMERCQQKLQELMTYATRKGWQ